MKVAVQTPAMGGAFKYILYGIINALEAAGVTVVTDRHNELYKRHEVDLYIGSLSHAKGNLYSERVEEFQRLPNCKYALHSQPFVDHLDEIKSLREKPRFNPTDIELKTANIVNPEVIWGYGWDNHAHLWEKWGRKWQSFMPAGDSVRFFDKQSGRGRDMVFLGGDWPYKRPAINEIINALKAIVPKVDLNVAGWGRARTVPFGMGNEFLNTGRVGFCPSEPHTKLLGIDVPERVFKLPLAGVAAVHDKVPFLARNLPNVPIGSTGMAVAELCFNLVEHEMNRLAVQIAQKHYVLANHTYFCRLKSLANALNMPELEAKMDKKIPKSEVFEAKNG